MEPTFFSQEGDRKRNHSQYPGFESHLGEWESNLQVNRYEPKGQLQLEVKKSWVRSYEKVLWPCGTATLNQKK